MPSLDELFRIKIKGCKIKNKEKTNMKKTILLNSITLSIGIIPFDFLDNYGIIFLSISAILLAFLSFFPKENKKNIIFNISFLLISIPLVAGINLMPYDSPEKPIDFILALWVYASGIFLLISVFFSQKIYPIIKFIAVLFLMSIIITLIFGF